MEKKYKDLRIFNVAMGFLHLLQGVLMLSLSKEFLLPINTSFVQFVPTLGKLAPVTKEIFKINLAPLVVGFLFLSALAHFTISVIPAINKWYNQNLKEGINLSRWIEYALSSSLMIVVISMLVGIYDGPTLILMFFMNMMMILFGWMMEVHNQTTQKTDWTGFIFGSLAGAVPWLVIALNLFGAGGETGHVPTFVYWIFFSIFIFFNIFALNMILQYKKIGPWKNYLFGEKMYIVLSLVAKSLLAWQVWAGTLRPV